MAVQLFEHNQTAYNAAVAMLAETGKAAVIHPTGTGSAFIGFKLCEENANKRILWLSPLETVFRTQCENWASAGGEKLDNIFFLTYAKLMMLSAEELSELLPDMMVYDEYHRAGATCWVQGVERLRSMYPDLPVLGLSAANTCDLDGRRDMTEEWFGNTTASEMTLGEAIARGVLDPSKYVLSACSCQKDLEKYRERVQGIKSETVRDEAAACLEALRRALENTAGLDAVFDQHMTERHGKYIVFVPDHDTMLEYMTLAQTWFGKIDREMHLYSVCSDDPSESRSLRDFQTDHSDHLRLLYCMDALSESVHAEDISGAVLVRPTISPINYKRQIGCALSASGSQTPVIFDVVNTIENMYSVDTIKEEMQEAVGYYRSHNGEKRIVHESFDVIDELAGCRTLFEQLEGMLSASWDIMYSDAEKYYHEHGTLEVPKSYRTDEGYSLWSWLSVQRRVRAGESNGILTDEQIEKLDRLGMRWDASRDIAWDKYYSAALAYYHEMHNLMPLQTYISPCGIRLGEWLVRLRTLRKSGSNCSYLTPEHIAQLDEIGMVWDVYDFVFERNYHSAVNYFRKNGDLECHQDYVDDQGIRLGAWLNYLRQQYKKRNCTFLTEEQFRLLDEIGMRWGGKHDVQWDTYYQCLVSYCDRTGNTDVPATWKEGGIPLGRWYRRQKDLYDAGELREDRKAKLLSLGLSLKIEDAWEKKFQLAKAYSEAHDGSLNVPGDYVVNGVWLNKWLSEMRLLGEGKRKKKLTDEQKQKLASIGMTFGKANNDHVWESHYQAVKAYIERTGSIAIPGDLCDKKVNLKKWVSRQVAAMKSGALECQKQMKLQALGFTKDEIDPFEVGIAHAKRYYEQHGDLLVKARGFLCDDGYNLSSWIRNIRSKKNSGKLSEDQMKRLEEIGMVWSVKRDVWNEMFEAAKKFAVPGTPLNIPFHQCAGNGKDLYDWFMSQRKAYAEGRLSSERLQKLLGIGAIMDRTDADSIRKGAEQPIELQKVDRGFLGNAVNG
ncbi:MAG: Helicase associated domain protein [Oscillospiraceae bacterium]|nr:Helicase associated domain protein [Oscillospiraceae bacterium]